VRIGSASALTLAYRYSSSSEVSIVSGSVPSRVPNVDRTGKPKTVYMTWDLYTSAAVAEIALQIGSHHPHGPFSSPTHRLDLNLSGVSYTFAGTVPGGTGTELTTSDSPLVTAITGLTP
jgi:hypothetical protein